MKRIILEMGTGNDLYGEDYTKAACRAVDDALHHSSLILFRSLGFDHADMDVRVTVAVQDPEKVDQAAVAATLPRGNVAVQVVKGGLDVVDEGAAMFESFVLLLTAPRDFKQRIEEFQELFR